jgi:capsular polysaccharide biosynthesis protein
VRSLPWIVLIALVSGGATYVVSKRIAKTYSSTATVTVTVQPVGGASDAATASNDLASQYAQLVTTRAVVDPAASRIDESASDLGAHISAGTVNAQNVINITAQSSTSAGAARRANAVAASFIGFIENANRQQASSYAKAITLQLGGRSAVAAAEQAVTRATEALNHATAATRPADEAQLSAAQTVLATRIANGASSTLSVAENSAAAQPALQLLGPAAAGSVVAPRPTLYALVAFLVAALVAAQLFVVFRRGPSA